MDSQKPFNKTNVIDRFYIVLTKPHNLAKILRWIWVISLLMLIVGYIIIFNKINPLIK